MDRGAWWATVHGVAKEQDMTEQLSTHGKWFKSLTWKKKNGNSTSDKKYVFNL